MQGDSLNNVRTRRVYWRQRAHGFLEDHADLTTADFTDNFTIGIELGDIHHIHFFNRAIFHDRAVILEISPFVIFPGLGII